MAHVAVRRDPARPDPWWWVCLLTANECGLDDLLGLDYVSQAEALAAATEHVARATKHERTAA